MRNAVKCGIVGLFALVMVPFCVVFGAAYTKPYTIMIYMNGSDLESEHGMATDDIIEMLESGLDSSAANLVLFTGGTVRWFNDVVPPIDCVIWEIKDGYIYELENLGVRNMGDPRTLSEFISFCKENYPADKFGLIMWDHGGGSIAGFGHDEVFDEDNLSLLDMGLAFEWAGLAHERLEFLGFDSCLMATVEMGLIAAHYAEYMIASEDLEPGEGWDYAFLGELNKDPSVSGGKLGVYIVDYFMEFFSGEEFEDETLHLSVVDLSKAAAVAAELGNLMEICRAYLDYDQMPSFKAFAKRRGMTKTFGVGSPRDNESDMVDIGDMAVRLADLFPEQAEAVLLSLDEAVLYNRHNSDTDLRGISAYYIYGGKATADASLGTYQALGMSYDYTHYLKEFADLLIDNVASVRLTRGGSQAQTPREFDYDDIKRTDYALFQDIGGEMVVASIKQDNSFSKFWPFDELTPWPSIGGRYVSLYEVNRTARAVHYAVPAQKNGTDCDIIVSFSESRPEGRILGVRNEYGFILQKGYEQVEPGDELAFYYQIARGHESDGETWVLGEVFTVRDGLTLTFIEADAETATVGLILTDALNNREYVIGDE